MKHEAKHNNCNITISKRQRKQYPRQLQQVKPKSIAQSSSTLLTQM
jgi:hypothetical protein